MVTPERNLQFNPCGAFAWEGLFCWVCPWTPGHTLCTERSLVWPFNLEHVCHHQRHICLLSCLSVCHSVSICQYASKFVVFCLLVSLSLSVSTLPCLYLYACISVWQSFDRYMSVSSSGSPVPDTMNLAEMGTKQEIPSSLGRFIALLSGGLSHDMSSFVLSIHCSFDLPLFLIHANLACSAWCGILVAGILYMQGHPVYVKHDA